MKPKISPQAENRKICYIVGAAPCHCPEFTVREGDLLIAADGGYETLLSRDLQPDLVVGDFDSLGRVPEDVLVVRHPVEKDDTDAMLAVKLGLDRGYLRFVLLRCLGGRLDHTLANIQTLSYIANRGGRGYLTDGSTSFTAVKNSEVSFAPNAQGAISVYSLTERCTGVSLVGLRYPLCDALLTSEFPLGVSNAFTDVRATVSVQQGILLVLWSGSLNCLEDAL